MFSSAVVSDLAKLPRLLHGRKRPGGHLGCDAVRVSQLLPKRLPLEWQTPLPPWAENYVVGRV